MSTTTATIAANAPAAATSAGSGAGRALMIGVAGLVLTVIGFFVSDSHAVALSYLVGLSYCTAIAIGMLLLVLIHHIFDASWSVVLRRQYEHAFAAFPWLALLFAPLLIGSWMGSHDLIWPWMNPDHEVHGGTVANDILYQKKVARSPSS
jgi:protein-S-isoprenylcysteine O-methyltransferase Ste14